MKCKACEVHWLASYSTDCWVCGEPGETSSVFGISGHNMRHRTEAGAQSTDAGG